MFIITIFLGRILAFTHSFNYLTEEKNVFTTLGGGKLLEEAIIRVGATIRVNTVFRFLFIYVYLLHYLCHYKIHLRSHSLFAIIIMFTPNCC